MVCGMVGLRQSLGRRMHILCVVSVEKHFIGKSSGFVTADMREPRHKRAKELVCFTAMLALQKYGWQAR